MVTEIIRYLLTLGFQGKSLGLGSKAEGQKYSGCRILLVCYASEGDSEYCCLLLHFRKVELKSSEKISRV